MFSTNSCGAICASLTCKSPVCTHVTNNAHAICRIPPKTFWCFPLVLTNYATKFPVSPQPSHQTRPNQIQRFPTDRPASRFAATFLTMQIQPQFPLFRHRRRIGRHFLSAGISPGFRPKFDNFITISQRFSHPAILRPNPHGRADISGCASSSRHSCVFCPCRAAPRPFRRPTKRLSRQGTSRHGKVSGGPLPRCAYCRYPGCKTANRPPPQGGGRRMPRYGAKRGFTGRAERGNSRSRRGSCSSHEEIRSPPGRRSPPAGYGSGWRAAWTRGR